MAAFQLLVLQSTRITPFTRYQPQFQFTQQRSHRRGSKEQQLSQARFLLRTESVVKATQSPVGKWALSPSQWLQWRQSQTAGDISFRGRPTHNVPSNCGVAKTQVASTQGSMAAQPRSNKQRILQAELLFKGPPRQAEAFSTMQPGTGPPVS